MAKIYLYIFFILVSLNSFAQYHAIYIPDEKLSEIQIDGNLNDWSWVPQDYFITNKNLMDIKNPYNEYDLIDLDIKILVAWNKNKNWLYLTAEVKDDLIKEKNPPFNIATVIADDIFKFAVDADNSGGYYASNSKYKSYELANAIHFYFRVPMKDSIDEFGNFPELNWLRQKSDILYWGWKTQNNSTYYEVGMALWDYIDVQKSTSKRHFLKESETIGLTISYYDGDITGMESKWFTLWSGMKYGANACQLSKFILDPPNQSGDTWQQILNVLTY